MSSATQQPVARLERLWWLAPGTLFCLVIGLTMLAAAWQGDAEYRLYGTPKYIMPTHVLLAGAAIAAFAIGNWLGTITGRRPSMSPADVDQIIRPYFWATFGLTLFGYAVWIAVGLKNGFSLGTFRELISTDDPLIAGQIREEMFNTVQGITTCTQFGIAAVLLGLWLVCRGQRLLVWPVLLLTVMAAVRALVFSERLALIELAVPATVLTLRMRVLGTRPPSAWRGLLKLAPVGAVAGLFVLFGTFEYFRSWRYYVHEFDSYPQFVVWRMAGYYTTAHNNSAMALDTQPMYPFPYTTVQMLWRFPGLSKTPLGYQNLTGIDPAERHTAMLERYGTPELNNEGGIFQPALDFGVAGIVGFWFVCGVAAGRVYRGYLAGDMASVLFYPLIFLAILETPRFLYLTYPRSLPAMLMLLLVTAAVARARRPAAIPASLPAPA